jgi:methylmalonyl-CoA mutase cobalamin-binding subunit
VEIKMSTHILLRKKIAELSEKWQKAGLPSRAALEAEAAELLRWKQQHGISGIWEKPPLMITSTLDDGMGQGLQVIHRYAELAGVQIIFLGLLQSPEKIISECQKHAPDILGLTVLQFDSQEDIKNISQSLPLKTRIIAGGPVFKADPDFADRSGIHFVAENVASFLELLLKL